MVRVDFTLDYAHTHKEAKICNHGTQRQNHDVIAYSEENQSERNVSRLDQADVGRRDLGNRMHAPHARMSNASSEACADIRRTMSGQPDSKFNTARAHRRVARDPSCAAQSRAERRQ